MENFELPRSTVTIAREVLVEISREAGLTILLDGMIGRERYESVSGSVDALAQFGELYSRHMHPAFARADAPGPYGDADPGKKEPV
ncbi:hypothetical protein [Burkholderia gladioli]|uniref:hypothetical protein n=1 Tax=Burkholderia gladioli TaxID=28095 RepID=UPI0034DAD316